MRKAHRGNQFAMFPEYLEPRVAKFRQELQRSSVVCFPGPCQHGEKLSISSRSSIAVHIFLPKWQHRCPALGHAVLDLDAQDFGNFLVHPLLAKADLASGKFEFRREGTALDIDIGRATFTGVWHGQPVVMEACQPVRWAFVQASSRVSQNQLMQKIEQKLMVEKFENENPALHDQKLSSWQYDDDVPLRGADFHKLFVFKRNKHRVEFFFRGTRQIRLSKTIVPISNASTQQLVRRSDADVPYTRLQRALAFCASSRSFVGHDGSSRAGEYRFPC